jgi:CNT family concentrative nucleoside transporter
MIDLHRYQGLIGIVVLLGLAFAMSNNRRKIDWRLVLWGLALQFAFALLILRTPLGEPFFSVLNTAVTKVVDYSGDGINFLFKPLPADYETSFDVLPPDDAGLPSPPGSGAGGEGAPPTHLRLKSTDGPRIAPPLTNLAFAVLPTVIFFSAITAVLYHLGIMQKLVAGIAWVMQRTMRTSGAETLSVAADIFVGQTEAPLVVRPYIKTMTRSELLTVMTGGFATIAGGVFALYVTLLQDQIPGIAGHLLAASVMCAPASIVFAKMFYPEVDHPPTLGLQHIPIEQTSTNVIDAFGDGITQGLKLVLNIAAMLIAFVAAVALVNGLLGFLSPKGSEPVTLQWLLGWLFRPLAWCLGAPWSEAGTLGTLLGEKLVLTELIAYTHLGEMQIGRDLSERTAVIASYALCGFANFASVGIQLGGLSEMAPNRRGDIAALVFRAMIAGALATCLTAAIAGLLL